MLGWGLEFTVYRFIGSVAFSTKEACTATVSQRVETPHLKAEVWGSGFEGLIRHT